MNYKLVITNEYKKRLKKFLKKHPDMLERYAKCIFILENDPFHPSLRLHCIYRRTWSPKSETLGQFM